MLLIDSIYINIGGAKILLDYLVEKLERTNINVFYLFDKRIVEQPYNIKSSNKFQYIQASLMERIIFYRQNKNQFDKVFILGNIPPPIQLNCKVFTYFHNSVFLEVPKDFSVSRKISYKLKDFIINSWKRNTDTWIVQSEKLKELFIKKFKENKKIQIIPFFPPLNAHNKEIFKTKCTYLYVSTGQENKNHTRLIKAFCNFYDKNKTGKLIVTVPKTYTRSYAIISDAIGKGYPIENLGYISRSDLIKYYEQSEYIVFPSLTESLGLGIVEGIEFECKVIAADLPYTYTVCEPSLVFNPLDVVAIEKAFEISLGDVKKSSAKIYDEIELILALLC